MAGWGRPRYHSSCAHGVILATQSIIINNQWCGERFEFQGMVIPWEGAWKEKKLLHAENQLQLQQLADDPAEGMCLTVCSHCSLATPGFFHSFQLHLVPTPLNLIHPRAQTKKLSRNLTRPSHRLNRLFAFGRRTLQPRRFEFGSHGTR